MSYAALPLPGSRARGAGRETEAAVSVLPAIAPTPEQSMRALLRGSIVHCKRLLLGWSRHPATIIQALFYPALTLFLFHIVFGDVIATASGQSSLYGNTPALVLTAAMSGAMISALGLATEKETGLLSRFATMPVHRAAGLTGRLLAEAIRVQITTIFVVAVGVLLGFEFSQGPVAALTFLGLPVLFGVAFSTLVTAMATISQGALLVNLVSILTTVMLFFNTGFVPVFLYPDWLQSTVANQPMSCAVDTMRGLSLGGPIAEPLHKLLLWCLGAIAVFGYPAVRGLRRAAETA